MTTEENGSGGGPRPRRQGRMPRQQGGRPNYVGVKLTDEEKVKLSARAASLGVSVQRLMVESALSGSAQTMTDLRALVAELLNTRRLVAAVSNNLNQLARVGNATGEIPPEVAAAAAAVTRALDRLDTTVAKLPVRRR